MQQGILKHLSLLKTKKHLITTTLFFVIGLIPLFSSFTIREEILVSDKINDYIILNSSKIISYLDSIDRIFISNSFDQKAGQKHYEAARKYYKEIEYYIEYHFPFHSKYFINGPLVNKAEFEYNYKTFQPHGFQIIEKILYCNEVDSSLNNKYELALLKKSFEYIKEKSRNKLFKLSTSVDMLRFEIIRIMALYLNGYDSTINKQNLNEIQQILVGLSNTIKLLEVNTSQKTSLNTIILSSNSYLSKNKDYDSFNRLHFITRYLKPLYEKLYDVYDTEAITESTNYAINIRSKKFYDEKWFNMKYFSVVLKDSNLVAKQAELGKILFFDPVLSGNNQRACVSCHNPTHAFGSNVDFNLSFQSTEKLKRNTPPLLNAVFQKSFFYDGRSLQLEDQASDVLTNHKEMFSSPENTVYKIKQSSDYKKLFQLAFANTEDTAITYYAILKSLSEFERTLISLNSRFDKYLRGDEKQLSKEEIEGYTIFSGKALCGSCHFFPLFNGLVPPFYGDNEFEVIGVPKNKLHKVLDPDSGRYNVSKNHIHVASFKTTGIRNIDQTAPYMHNGIYNTLDEVLDFYKKGGGSGLGINVPNQTLPFDSLQLTKTEINNLKKFIISLSDKSLKIQIPKTLPVIHIKELENRKVGGYY